MRVTHALLDSMIEGGGGSIVNLHSVEGMRGYPIEPIYASMKAAVAQFTTCLAVEQGRNGIRVNGIGTDLCQTPQVDYRTGWEEHEHLWPSWAPVGRLGWPMDDISRKRRPLAAAAVPQRLQPAIIRMLGAPCSVSCTRISALLVQTEGPYPPHVIRTSSTWTTT